MDADLFGRLFRTALQAVGMFVAGKYMTEDQWLAVSGGLLTIITTGFTIYSAKRAAADKP